MPQCAYNLTIIGQKSVRTPPREGVVRRIANRTSPDSHCAEKNPGFAARVWKLLGQRLNSSGSVDQLEAKVYTVDENALISTFEQTHIG